MKLFKIKKIISIICSLIVFLSASLGLMLGLRSIGADGWDKLGVIFIMPSIFSLLIIILDFFITIEKIKRALVYSYFSSLIKIGIIVLFIPSTIYDYKYEIEYGVSNLRFDFTLIVLLMIATIPSVLNIMKLTTSKKSRIITS